MPEERPKPPAAGGPAQPGSADPSMEDILASIRRILNEDEPPAPAPPARAGGAPAEPGGEPLELTEEMLVSRPTPLPPPEPPPPASLPAPPPGAPMGPPMAPAPATLPQDALLAPAVAAAASASVGQLLRTVAAERSSAVTRGGPTIEDVVREELRPLLKAWLDAHLPGLVERLVRAEIERVVGRALS